MSWVLTTNYSIKKVDINTEIDTWSPLINGNWDIIDGQMKTNANAAAAAQTSANTANSGLAGKANTSHTHNAGTDLTGTLAAAQTPAYTGDVTKPAASLTTTIAAGAVTNAKMANMAANTIKGSIAGGAPVDLTGAQVLTITGAAPLASPGLTGVPTAPTATAGTNTTQLATTAFVTAAVAGAGGGTIADNAVTNAKLADMGANTIKGSVAGGDPADLTVTQVLSMLNAQTKAGFVRPAAGAYTLLLTDAWQVVEFNGASAAAWTIPPNSSVAFPVNTEVHGVQRGTGQATITPGSGVTVNASGGKLKSAAQYSAWTAKKVATDEWYVWGDLST